MEQKPAETPHSVFSEEVDPTTSKKAPAAVDEEKHQLKERKESHSKASVKPLDLPLEVGEIAASPQKRASRKQRQSDGEFLKTADKGFRPVAQHLLLVLKRLAEVQTVSAILLPRILSGEPCKHSNPGLREVESIGSMIETL